MFAESQRGENIKQRIKRIVTAERKVIKSTAGAAGVKVGIEKGIEVSQKVPLQAAIAILISTQKLRLE